MWVRLPPWAIEKQRVLEMMKFGIEIEGFCPNRKALKKELCSFKNWLVGWDSSIAPKKGDPFEIRMREPCVYSDLDELLNELRNLLTVMKKEGCQVNHRSGLHIHVSDGSKVVDNDKLHEVRHTAKFYHNRYRRKRYASNDVSRGKYSAIHHYGENRLEFRAFDSSLNLRHIARSVKYSLKLFNETVLPVGAG